LLDHIAAHLVVVLFGATSLKSLKLCHFKSDWDEIWQECCSNKCAPNDLLVFDFISHFQDGGHNAFSHRKVLPSASICVLAPIQQRPPVPGV